jgi:hypothetical protein
MVNANQFRDGSGGAVHLSLSYGQIVHLTGDDEAGSVIWAASAVQTPGGFDVMAGSELVGKHLQLGRTIVTGGRMALEGCHFTGCLSTNSHGGALYLTGGIVTLVRCIFNTNYAISFHESIGYNLNGGAISAGGSRSSPVKLALDNCEFNDNIAASRGGAIALWVGATAFVDFTAISCTFSGNHACGGSCDLDADTSTFPDNAITTMDQTNPQNYVYVKYTNAEAADIIVPKAMGDSDGGH